MPIKIISIENQRGFIKTVNKILSITKFDDYLESASKQARVKDYEKQIDRMVYKLYGLTQKEIDIVEEFDKK